MLRLLYRFARNSASKPNLQELAELKELQFELMSHKFGLH